MHRVLEKGEALIQDDQKTQLCMHVLKLPPLMMSGYVRDKKKSISHARQLP